MTYLTTDVTVPIADSADNVDWGDVIGNKTDTHLGSSIYSFAKLINEHIHTESLCYPTGAAGVVVTASNAAPWTLGNYAQIVPINTIASDFDIHFVNIEGANNNATYELVIYAVTTEIGRIRFTTIDIANARLLPSLPFISPVQAANAQIQAKVMSSTGAADTITITLHYHIY